MIKILEIKLGGYIKEQGIKICAISDVTGISSNILYRSFTGERELRADEFFRICEFLKVDPNEFY